MSDLKIKKHGSMLPVWIFLLVLVDLALLINYLVSGKNVALFNPKGFIAQEQHSLMVFILLVLLAIAIPTISLVFYIAWKYRETNTEPSRTPKAHHSKYHVLGIWLIPILIMFVIAGAMIPATHKLDPRVAIASDAEPITIQVIALRWKWLFIYPEQQIATVNFVQLPVNTPVKFEMTADESPMSSFWIPNLGGQLYTMTGHVNRLNLMADTIGDYPGSSAEINGRGFAGMKFTARVSTDESFDEWVKIVKQSPDELNAETYKELVLPSESNPPGFYSRFDSDLYDKVVMKYTGTAEGDEHHE